MIDNESTHDLIAIAEHVQELINLEYRRVNWKPKPESVLDQAGLRNGAEVVRDYVDHGEAGIAFEHLFYMVKETGIKLSEDYLARLSDVANKLSASSTDSP